MRPGPTAVLSLLVLAVVAVLVDSSAWDANNNPTLFSDNYEYTFSQLDTDSNLTKTMPWSDTYWPSFQSGIAHRWNSPKPHDFEYGRLTLAQLRAMTPQQLARLSPAEKYDIYNSRYDYPTVQAEWSRTSPSDAQWEGLCHGWAPASLYYKQPDAVTMQNKDGLSIPFGSSDVKALLTYFVAMYDEGDAETLYIGQRCKYDIESQPAYANKSECADMNAGGFHIVLANQLGSQMRQGFIVDRDRSFAVWNQPVYAFNTTVLGFGPRRSDSAPGTAQTAHVLTVMAYGKETVPQWRAHPTYTVAEQYEYFLDLDSQGRVLGGSHVTWDRADFAWSVQIADFYGYFAAVRSIYNAATRTAADADRAAERGADEAPLTLLPSAERAGRAPGANHTVLSAREGALEQPPYAGRVRRSWSLAPSGDAVTGIELVFGALDTERHRDLVRVYEGAKGDGPLVAVLHGAARDVGVRVSAPAAYVVFSARDTAGGSGFTAVYRALSE